MAQFSADRYQHSPIQLTARATQVMKYVSYHTVGRAVGYIRLCHNLLVSSAGFIILAMRL